MPDFSVTVLGASPAWANPGHACSGYLVRSEADNVLLECGSGTLGRLRQHVSLDDLRAIVVSHLHADHFIDLISMRYGLKYGGLRNDPRLPLYVPPGAREFFTGLGRALDGDEHFFDGTFELFEYSPAQKLKLGSLTLQFRPVKHYIPAYAMAVQADRRLVFSGDAAPCKPLVELARAADLFLCEAAIRGPEEDDPNPENRGHMTALEAAELARRAQVSRLILTHYRIQQDSDPPDIEEAARAFGGPIEFAREGVTYRI